MSRQVYYELSQEQVKRINILKMLFALFVVYIHSGVEGVRLSTGEIESALPSWFDYYSYMLTNVIPCCAVSGFFFISSFLLYRKEFIWKDNIRKRIRSILIPYLLMNTFWIVVFAIAQHVPLTQVFFANEDNMVANFSFLRWMQAYGIGARYPFLYPLWFLRNLLVLNLFATVIRKIIDYAPRVTFAAICFVFLFVKNFPFNNFGYLLNPLDLSMWCFGYYFVKNKWDLKKFENNKVLLLLFIVSVIYRIATKNTSIPGVMSYRLCIIIALLFWYAWFSKKLDGKIQEVFLKFSPFNFGVYIFHEMNLTFCQKLIAKLFGSNTTILVLEHFFLPLAIVILVILFCNIFKKIMPKLYSVLIGARV